MSLAQSHTMAKTHTTLSHQPDPEPEDNGLDLVSPEPEGLRGLVFTSACNLLAVVEICKQRDGDEKLEEEPLIAMKPAEEVLDSIFPAVDVDEVASRRCPPPACLAPPNPQSVQNTLRVRTCS
jgi:hypothetical protein